MIPLTLTEVAQATGGTLHGDGSVVVDGPVVTDSRQAGPGSLYVARLGERADGHDFVAAAKDAGAVAALTSRVVEEVPCVVVEDVDAAFGALARAVVDALRDLTVVGITGSSGKTSTKDLLAHVLAQHAPTVATQESYNGEVGVPLTVTRVERGTRLLVAEMGARGVGHIRFLTTIAPPRIGVVLNVGTAHVGEFGSRELVAQAKGELVEALPEDGVAVLNGDDPLVRAMAERTRARVVLVGSGPDCEVRATDIVLDERARPTFTLTTPEGCESVRLGLSGEHHVGNALAVAAVGLAVGMTTAEVAQALAGASATSRWRMEVTERPDGVTIVNDAYNANPESMRAALKALVAMTSTGRSWAVLGEMLELGEESVTEHDAIGRLAVRLDVDRLVAVGEGARAIHQGASLEGSYGEESVHVPDADAAFALLEAELRPGDVVLLKSSRDAGLRWLGERLATADGASR